MTASHHEDYFVYVGTYTQRESHVLGKSDGIYVYRMNLGSGRLTHVSTMAGVVNPSFLAADPTGQALYAVNEVMEFDGEATGTVSAFAIDRQSGRLSLLNRHISQGTAPCHLSVDQTGRTLLVANYGSGSVAAFPIRPGGELAPASSFVQHRGSSVNPERQQSPHAHSITIDPGNRFAFVADLGLDKVLGYQLDPAAAVLTPHQPPAVATAPGAGPRHFCFHPNGRFAYLINEIGSTLTAFTYDPVAGALAEINTLSTLPGDFQGLSYCADIHVAPSGRFVYGSNRGHDSIAIFAIDPDSGAIRAAGHTSTAGQVPRNFAVDPTGTYLLAANQNSDTIIVFHIDPQSGQLAATGEVAAVPTPVCLHFVAA